MGAEDGEEDRKVGRKVSKNGEREGDGAHGRSWFSESKGSGDSQTPPDTRNGSCLEPELKNQPFKTYTHFLDKQVKVNLI